MKPQDSGKTRSPGTVPIGEVVDAVAADHPDWTALVMPTCRLTYGELAEASDRFAAGLCGIGVRRGDRVGILMHNGLEFVLALLGAAKLGAIAVPVNGRFKQSEAGYVLAHAEMNALLLSHDEAGTDYPALVASVLETIAPTLRPRVIVDFSAQSQEFLTREDFEAAGSDVKLGAISAARAKVQPDDVALIMYTSGTTARPKGCLLTHASLTRTTELLMRTRYGLQAREALWNPLPLFHTAGIGPMLGVFSVGGAFCHIGHFEPGPSLDMIEREQCVALNPAFDSIWLRVVEHPRFTQADLACVRVIQCIGTPARMEAFAAALPNAVQVTSYGSTELSSTLIMGRRSEPKAVRFHSLGKVIDGMDVKVVDPATANSQPTDVPGELRVRGFSCFSGYFKDSEQTAAAFDADGYFRTGDLLSVDRDGNYHFEGRLKDMFKVGGENVSALELEDFLLGLAGVRVAQVVGVPDRKYDEVPAAFLELLPGVSMTEDEVIAFCRGRVANYKTPRYIRFVTDWPLSGTKIKKFELRSQLSAELSGATVPAAGGVSITVDHAARP
jgi:fatty-acyl-CoA synthase